MRLSNGPVFSLLAVYMPLAVLTALIFLLRAFLPLQTAILFISGGLSALAASLYCDFMKDVRFNRTAAVIRGTIIVAAVSYVFSSLFRWGIPWEQRFFPSLPAVLVSLGTLYVWFSVISLKEFFGARKRFEAYTELYRGEELYRALYEDIDLLQYIDNEIFKIKRKYLIQFIFIGIILFFNIINKIYLPPVLYLLLIVILAGGICIFGFFGIMRREHHCAAEGMSLSVSDRFRHIWGVGIFSVLSIAAGIVLSSDKSLLPFSLITGFLLWLLGLFRHTPLPVTETAIPETFEPMPYYELPSLPFDPAENSGPSPVWLWLKYGCIVLAAAVFVWFMIAPLFDRDRNKLSFRRKLGRIIAEWFTGVLAGLASFFASIGGGKTVRKLHRPGAEAVQRMAGAVLGAYSPAKKRELKQSVTLFARLIIWGEAVRQAAWKPIFAPGEYCCFLAGSAPDEHDLNKKIIRCGELFEKALYSADVLSDTERKEFEGLVEGITSVVC